MFRSILLPALAAGALVSAPAWAQSAAPSTSPRATGPGSTGTKDDGAARSLPQKIRDKLQSEGFKDVEVVPNSFIVRARDKDDNPIMMLIGPNGTTMITQPKSGHPSTAEHKDGKGQIIQE